MDDRKYLDLVDICRTFGNCSLGACCVRRPLWGRGVVGGVTRGCKRRTRAAGESSASPLRPSRSCGAFYFQKKPWMGPAVRSRGMQPKEERGIKRIVICSSQSVPALLSELRLCMVWFLTVAKEGCAVSRLDRFLIRRLETPRVGVWGDSFGT